MYNSIYILFIICMVTYSISSMWLYSPGLIADIRELWISFWGNKKYFSWLQYLGICQLCCGFWIGAVSSLIILDANMIIIYIIYSLIAAVFSWTLGAFTNSMLWFRALCEKVVAEKNE